MEGAAKCLTLRAIGPPTSTLNVRQQRRQYALANFLPGLPSKDSCLAIEKTISKLQDSKPAQSKIVSFLKSDLQVQLPLHISLSAPLVLKTAQKDEFREALEEAIASSGAHRFGVTPVDVAWVPNVGQSRFFLVLKLSRPENDDLNKLLSACNTCAKTWGLDLLYSQNSDNSCQSLVTKPDTSGAFHISIAWTLRQPTYADQEVINTRAARDLAEMTIEFSSVKIKIGNVVTDVQLSKPPHTK